MIVTNFASINQKVAIAVQHSVLGSSKHATTSIYEEEISNLSPSKVSH